MSLSPILAYCRLFLDQERQPFPGTDALIAVSQEKAIALGAGFGPLTAFAGAK